MNKDIQNGPNQGDEEVDLIRLLNYFKNGIKSFFRMIWNVIAFFIQFIILLKRNWILILSLTLLGGIYAMFLRPILESNIKTYEMVIQSNPISNFELYAFSREVNDQDAFNTDSNAEGVGIAQSLGIIDMKVEAMERSEDVINSYFNQIELASFRGDQTDTLYYKAFEIDEHKAKMEKSDFAFQKLRIKANKNVPSKEIQEKLLNYLNNTPGIKMEQEARLSALRNYEYQLKRNVTNIDSLLTAIAISNKEISTTGPGQLLMNTSARGTVEGDLLRYSELFNRKLYGTQKMIASYKNGINIVSDLRSINKKSVVSNPIIRYSILGLALGIFLVILIYFNQYLNRFAKRNKI